MIKAFLVAALIASVQAYCPNGCSGHGSCGGNDKCTCYTRPSGEPAWSGHDCSARTCPTGKAWVATATAANEAHPSAECSCFDNYEGIACERTVCPNDCSGRGICYTENSLASIAGATYGPAVAGVAGTSHAGASSSIV